MLIAICVLLIVIAAMLLKISRDINSVGETLVSMRQHLVDHGSHLRYIATKEIVVPPITVPPPQVITQQHSGPAQVQHLPLAHHNEINPLNPR